MNVFSKMLLLGISVFTLISCGGDAANDGKNNSNNAGKGELKVLEFPRDNELIQKLSDDEKKGLGIHYGLQCECASKYDDFEFGAYEQQITAYNEAVANMTQLMEAGDKDKVNEAYKGIDPIREKYEEMEKMLRKFTSKVYRPCLDKQKSKVSSTDVDLIKAALKKWDQLTEEKFGKDAYLQTDRLELAFFANCEGMQKVAQIRLKAQETDDAYFKMGDVYMEFLSK